MRRTRQLGNAGKDSGNEAFVVARWWGSAVLLGRPHGERERRRDGVAHGSGGQGHGILKPRRVGWSSFMAPVGQQLRLMKLAPGGPGRDL